METEVVKKKVVIGLPGNNFSSKFLVSWTSSLNTLWEMNKYDIIYKMEKKYAISKIIIR